MGLRKGFLVCYASIVLSLTLFSIYSTVAASMVMQVPFQTPTLNASDYATGQTYLAHQTATAQGDASYVATAETHQTVSAQATGTANAHYASTVEAHQTATTQGNASYVATAEAKSTTIAQATGTASANNTATMQAVQHVLPSTNPTTTQQSGVAYVSYGTRVFLVVLAGLIVLAALTWFVYTETPRYKAMAIQRAGQQLEAIRKAEEEAREVARQVEVAARETARRAQEAARRAQEEKQIAEERRRASRYVPAHVQQRVYARDQGRCVECGSTTQLQYDHILPYSKGGGNQEENIQLLCKRCNQKKGARIGG
jgi:5-methylcytosine-specific restriction endonuclease McrA